MNEYTCKIFYWISVSRSLCFILLISGMDGVSSKKTRTRNSGIMQKKQLFIKKLECYRWMKKTPLPSSGLFCNRTWDNLMCWPDIVAGTVAEKPCPDYIHGFAPNAMATKICHNNGSWYVNPSTNKTWTDFSLCTQSSPSNVPDIIRNHLPQVMLMSSIGYGASLISLIAAVIIMIACKRLHCSRNTVHINLFMSFILRAFISFLKDQLLVEGVGFAKDVHYINSKIQFDKEGTHWECRLFFTVFYYALLANYMWIFVEGLYLHILILVAVFTEKSKLHWYIITGWGLPIFFVIPWVITRITNDNVLCWNTHPKSEIFWIIKGPIVATIIVNFFFFLNIVRILFTKLNAAHYPERRRFRYRRLAKSTLILIPLFGVYYILFISLPRNLSGKALLVKLYIELFFNSFQGLVVALLFCFLNGEVRIEMRKRWERSALRRHSESIRVRLGSLQLSTVRFGSPQRSVFESRMDDTTMSVTTPVKKKNGILKKITEGEEPETEPLSMSNSQRNVPTDDNVNISSNSKEAHEFGNCLQNNNSYPTEELYSTVKYKHVNQNQDYSIKECADDDSDFKNHLIDYHTDIPLGEYEKTAKCQHVHPFCLPPAVCGSSRVQGIPRDKYHDNSCCRCNDGMNRVQKPSCGVVIRNANVECLHKNVDMFDDKNCDFKECNCQNRHIRGGHVISVPDVVMMNRYLNFRSSHCPFKKRKTNSENDIRSNRLNCIEDIKLLSSDTETAVETDYGHCGGKDNEYTPQSIIDINCGRRPLSTGSIALPLGRPLVGETDDEEADCDIIRNKYVYSRGTRSCSNIGETS